MKKQLLIFSTIISAFVCTVSCNKADEMVENNPSSTQQLMSTMLLPSNSNSEVHRMFNDVQNNDYVFGIIANPNFGISKSNDIILSGKTPSDFTLQIDNTTFNNVNGQWLLQNPLFETYYGKNVNIKIIQGSNTIQKTIYIPKVVTCTKICDNYQYINRTGNIINWTVDNLNPMNKVALSYELYDNDDILNSNAPYKKDIILIEDNGQFSIDNIISETKCKRINFMVVSGNAFSFTVNQKKYLFNLFSADHHEYLIH